MKDIIQTLEEVRDATAIHHLAVKTKVNQPAAMKDVLKGMAISINKLNSVIDDLHKNPMVRIVNHGKLLPPQLSPYGDDE